MKKHFLITCSVAAIAALMSVSGARAETVRTQTIVQNVPVADVVTINFDVFDVNRDGVFSMPEVGEYLFTLFDQDKNQLIDNMEWDDENIFTIAPMEKSTYQFVDHNNDGRTDKMTYTYETFYQASGLIRFDEQKDGLSASEFIGTGFQELDISDNNMIDMEEWKRAYLASLPRHALEENYNNH